MYGFAISIDISWIIHKNKQIRSNNKTLNWGCWFQVRSLFSRLYWVNGYTLWYVRWIFFLWFLQIFVIFGDTDFHDFLAVSQNFTTIFSISSVISQRVSWFLVIFHDFSWFLTIYHDSSWSTMTPLDFPRSSSISLHVFSKLFSHIRPSYSDLYKKLLWWIYLWSSNYETKFIDEYSIKLSTKTSKQYIFVAEMRLIWHARI